MISRAIVAGATAGLGTLGLLGAAALLPPREALTVGAVLLPPLLLGAGFGRRPARPRARGELAVAGAIGIGELAGGTALLALLPSAPEIAWLWAVLVLGLAPALLYLVAARIAVRIFHRFGDKEVETVSRAATALLVVALCCSALPARALPPRDAGAGDRDRALESFKSAMDRIDRRDWAAAIDGLERAVDLLPHADGRLFVLRYGRLTRNYYLPYFYLGMACYESGDRARAAEYLAKAAAEGEVDQHEDLRRRLERMQRDLGVTGGGSTGRAR